MTGVELTPEEHARAAQAALLLSGWGRDRLLTLVDERTGEGVTLAHHEARGWQLRPLVSGDVERDCRALRSMLAKPRGRPPVVRGVTAGTVGARCLVTHLSLRYADDGAVDVDVRTESLEPQRAGQVPWVAP